MIIYDEDKIILEEISDLLSFNDDKKIFSCNNLESISIIYNKYINESEENKKLQAREILLGIPRIILHTDFNSCINFNILPQELLYKEIQIKSRGHLIRKLILDPNSNTLLSSF